ncbi:MAG: hypothetical protein CBC25_04305 [Pelagibacteraceae bacterium TMED65]|nr:MAG: hypothetical protein CBC25_04305 [Pelagibacteraceae bacterium TMED65]
MFALNKKKLLVLLILVPVFISFSPGGQIGLDRVGGVASPYLLTLPISFFAIVILLFKFSEQIFQDKILVIFILYSIAVFFIGSIYNGALNFGLLKTLIWMNVFVSLLTVFKHYFRLNYYSLEHSLKIERFIVFSYFSILVLTWLSFFAYGRNSFIFPSMKIYNFEQYFAFIFIPLIAIIGSYSFILFIIGCILTIGIAILSVNVTALLILLVVMSLVTGSYFMRFIKTKIIYQLTIFVSISFAIFWIFTLPYWADSTGMSSLTIRADNINSYFDNIKWYSIIFPFLHSSRGVHFDMHNELLEVFNAVGILGLLLFYYLYLRVLRNFSEKYRIMRLTFVFSIFISGSTLELTLHVYTLIVFSFMSAFYEYLSNQSDLQIQSVRKN